MLVAIIVLYINEIVDNWLLKLYGSGYLLGLISKVGGKETNETIYGYFKKEFSSNELHLLLYQLKEYSDDWKNQPTFGEVDVVSFLNSAEWYARKIGNKVLNQYENNIKLCALLMYKTALLQAIEKDIEIYKFSTDLFQQIKERLTVFKAFDDYLNEKILSLELNVSERERVSEELKKTEQLFKEFNI
ncbi:hypothetical protein [Ekhidna sp.]|uniref:hypothetical protein n=1 Tax=Ekhidna sp. TaxID=2608089 RepID=UPI003518962B